MKIEPSSASACSGWHYCEAVIVSRDNRGTLLEWHDGQRERLKRGMDWPLHYLADGCTIGVRVRFGQGNRAIELHEDVAVIAPPNAEAVATASKTHPQTPQTNFEPLPPAHGSAQNDL